MKSKTILILGASSDMAMATAREFAKEGYNQVLVARKSDRLKPLASDLENRYEVNVQIEEFEASDFAGHEAIADKYAGDAEVVLFAVGYLGDQEKAEEDWSEAALQIEVNYTAGVSALNSVAAAWKEKGGGTIIGITSVAGDRGRASNFVYGSAKAGFTAYLSGLRNSLFHKGIHVMTVNPGFVSSKMTDHLDLPSKLTSSPEQVGKAIYRGYKKSKNVIYVSGIWRLIMLIICSIPEFIFKRLKL